MPRQMKQDAIKIMRINTNCSKVPFFLARFLISINISTRIHSQPPWDWCPTGPLNSPSRSLSSLIFPGGESKREVFLRGQGKARHAPQPPKDSRPTASSIQGAETARSEAGSEMPEADTLSHVYYTSIKTQAHRKKSEAPGTLPGRGSAREGAPLSPGPRHEELLLFGPRAWLGNTSQEGRAPLGDALSGRSPGRHSQGAAPSDSLSSRHPLPLSGGRRASGRRASGAPRDPFPFLRAAL